MVCAAQWLLRTYGSCAGGIQRGTGELCSSLIRTSSHVWTDVIKALCLGARAVGLGRAFLYAQSVWLYSFS